MRGFIDRGGIGSCRGEKKGSRCPSFKTLCQVRIISKVNTHTFHLIYPLSRAFLFVLYPSNMSFVLDFPDGSGVGPTLNPEEY